ncbi:uncharacterized protein LOC119075817 [Bradysia coprophila]|uniref:uncharacterized protein LOC119075817 n=1 Tax=Bradysia coprophila TaxID=38358 RepID=UPI00187DAEC6|nr:uncharacterized protein LOC119075817 [Bradysia coprophila]
MKRISSKKDSLFKKMIVKKKQLVDKSRPRKMDEFDAVQCNVLLKYIERFVIVGFDDHIPTDYQKIINDLRGAIPANIQNTTIELGSTSPLLGNAIYNTAYAAGKMSLTQSDQLQTLLNAIMNLFEQYRQPSPLSVKIDSSATSSSPSSLSEASYHKIR